MCFYNHYSISIMSEVLSEILYLNIGKNHSTAYETQRVVTQYEVGTQHLFYARLATEFEYIPVI